MTGFTGLILYGAETRHWLRFADGAPVGRGKGVPEVDDGEAVAALYPGADVLILPGEDDPDLSDAQRRALAERHAADVAAVPLEALHVAGGVVGAATDKARFATWLDALGELGIDPDPVVPAMLALPDPVLGHATAVIGGEALVRGQGRAFADDPVLTPLLLGSGPVEALSPEQVEAAMATVAVSPPVNLRQGEFARRNGWLDRLGSRKLLAALVGGILLVSILIPLALMLRLNGSASDQLEQAQAVAREAVGGSDGDAIALLDQRLRGIQGGGAGFAATLGAARHATLVTTDSELRAVQFEPAGQMRATVSVTNPASLDQWERAAASFGFIVRRGAVTTANGRTQADMELALP